MLGGARQYLTPTAMSASDSTPKIFQVGSKICCHTWLKISRFRNEKFENAFG
jgi:hypothetical protein